MLPCQLHNSVLLHLKNMKLCQNRRELKSLMVRYSIWPVKLDDHPLLIAQPDIMIVCDTDKLDRKRCNGAPDFIIEIVSPSNSSDDYIKKLYYYKKYGVREYWIVDPNRRAVTVNYFEGDIVSMPYTFNSTVKVNIYDNLYLDFREIEQVLNS